MSFTASGMAAAITTAQGPAQDTTIQDDANLKIATGVVNYIKTNLQFLIPSGAIDTVGGPAAQVGPSAPVDISVVP